jgi:hypothetical protein
MQRPAPGSTRNVLVALLAVVLLALAGSTAGPGVVSAVPRTGTTGGAGHVDGADRRDGEVAVGRQATAVASHARTHAQRHHLDAGAAVLPTHPGPAAPLAGRPDVTGPVAPLGSTDPAARDSRAPPA